MNLIFFRKPASGFRFRMNSLFFSIFGEKLIFNGSQSKLDWDYFGSEIFKEFFLAKNGSKVFGEFRLKTVLVLVGAKVQSSEMS